MLEFEKATLQLENLGLEKAAAVLTAQLETAAKSDCTYLDFLNNLLNSEVDERRKRSEETRLKLSRLPQKKVLADFDFESSQVSTSGRSANWLPWPLFTARRM